MRLDCWPFADFLSKILLLKQGPQKRGGEGEGAFMIDEDGFETLLIYTLSVCKHVFHLDFSHIILMLADDAACSPRNPRPGIVFFI